MLIKRPGAKPGTVAVTFQFPANVWAESVHLVGDFNGWDHHSLPMLRQRRDDDAWEVTVTLDVGRSYEFRYLINEEMWSNDSQADDYATNPYGADNSVVKT
jgi:1,4-alpha-glucan branching enzyme